MSHSDGPSKAAAAAGDASYQEHAEPSKAAHVPDRGADVAAQMIGDRRVELTDEDNKHIRRKTDKHILPILVWVYFLQILDKSVLGYGAIFGLREDTHLTGNQYSLVSSVAAIVQLCWQPFSSWLIVTVPHRILMPCLILGWGIAQTCMAASTSFGSLIATRALLGLFEAGCLPLFSVITSQWYRRAEQPMRVAAWYSTNGLATMVAAAVSYGLAQIRDGPLAPWQTLFLLVGAVTVVSAPFVYWLLDSDVPSARFLTEHEKLQAIERLRANNTGTGSREFKLPHVWEALLEPKTWLFVGIALCINVTAAVSNTFGPIVIEGLGFESERASLLNIPAGLVQLLVIFPSSWAASRFRHKAGFLAASMLPVLAGAVMLYVMDRGDGNAAAGPLAAYYLLAFVFAGNPLLVSWTISNVAGTTKKSVIMSLYNAGCSAGSIVGPLLFASEDAPYYYPGLLKVMGVTAALVAAIGLQFLNLVFLNKLQARKRVANGKPADIRDLSMQHHYAEEDNNTQQQQQQQEAGGGEEGAGEVRLGENAFLDLTDRQNDEFVYVY